MSCALSGPQNGHNMWGIDERPLAGTLQQPSMNASFVLCTCTGTSLCHDYHVTKNRARHRCHYRLKHRPHCVFVRPPFLSCPPVMVPLWPRCRTRTHVRVPTNDNVSDADRRDPFRTSHCAARDHRRDYLLMVVETIQCRRCHGRPFSNSVIAVENKKSGKNSRFEERYNELEKKIMQKPKVEKSQGNSAYKKSESKQTEEQCRKDTSEATKKTVNEGEAAAARTTECNDDNTAVVKDEKDEAMKAAAAQCKSRSGSKSIVADRAEAAVAAHKPDEEEIAKDNQTTNRVPAKEHAEGEAETAVATKCTEGDAQQPHHKDLQQRQPRMKAKRR